MAYVIKSNKSEVTLPYLPKECSLKDGTKVLLDYYHGETDELQVHDIMRHIVNEEGNSYPQEDLSNVEDFRAYYLTHEVFVCRDPSSGVVLGSFYVKPNFPGRCSHICNAGFAVKKEARGKGVASLMVENYLQIARDLGYQASFFNLVFVNNTASIRLWEKFKFQEIGTIPKAGNLKGIGYTDAKQFYYDLTKLEKKT